jgi:Ca-activated chloride channel family protein
VGFSDIRWLRALPGRPSPLRRLPDLIAALALAIVLVALMDPVLPYSETHVQSHGLDIALVLDLSSSMQEAMGFKRPPRSMTPGTGSTGSTFLTRPLERTRLDTTKDALRDFISRRHDDRIGLIVFSGNAYVVSPMTFDYDYLREYVDMADDQSVRNEGMTAIGNGVALASYLLVKRSTDRRRNKVVIVFTDGENNFGRDPIEAIEKANAAGITVHVVGIDVEDQVKQRPAVRRLVDAVRRHGGQYYDADSVRELRAAYGAIDVLEKGLLTSKVYVRNAPVFDWFVAPALVLFVAAMVLRAVPYFADFT